MTKFLFIAICSFICVVIEGLLDQNLGRWFKPNLCLCLVVFLNLFKGTHPSMVAALLAGLMKDSLSAKFFGLNMLSLAACAQVTTFLKSYIYETGSMGSRVMIVFLAALFNLLIQYAVNAMMEQIYFTEVFRYVMLPEVLATTLVAPYAFTKFKQCALRFFA